MAKTKNQDHLSKWSFLLGCIISILVGFINIPQSWSILAILGIVVGFIGINSQEIDHYLVAVIALIVIGTVWMVNTELLSPIVGYVQRILASFTTFVGVAGIVVAIKYLWATGRK